MTEKHKDSEKEQKEEHEHKKEQKERGIRISYTSMFVIVAVVCLVIGFAVGFVLFSSSATPITDTIIAKDQAMTKAQTFIQSIVGSASTVKVSNIQDLGNIYIFDVQMGNDTFQSYMTKDGLLLFPSAYELNQTITPPTPTPVKNITKTDKPVIELFVMSFCPYGIQAETAMKPVVDLLGTKADFKLRYIASVVGTTIDSVQSLHGINEAKEDLRQLCIAKYYDQATLWKYVSYIADGYPSNFSIGTIETKWKEAAAFASINVTKIEACLASESVGLMKLEEQTADGYGVSGSPTLIINGVKYSGSRTPDAYKQSICNAFTTIPAECSTALSTAGGTASGGC